MPSVSPTAGGAELAWETVALLKNQQRRREAALAEALEAKEQALKHWRLRAEELEREAREQRARAEGGDERTFAELLDAQSKLEQAARQVQAERARHDDDRRRLEAALQESRLRLEAEVARAREAEALWTKREAQSLADLRDVQSAADRRQKEAAQADESVRALKGSLSEAKNALEKTLAELLLERQERGRVEEERAKALAKTDEVEKHFAELQKLWDEERAQWRELWDRERSTWEAQRVELAQWEENLRREREAWHAELQEKEKAHVSLSDSLAGKIRETTAAASNVAERMRQLETREERDRALQHGATARAAELAAASKAARVRAAKAGGLALAALSLVAGVVPAWRWAFDWRYVPEASAPVSAANPTALGYDGNLLWISDWSGRLTAVDPMEPRRRVKDVAPPAAGPFRPTSLAFGGGLFWTLDAAQARVLRQRLDKPETVVASRPSPGPAPTALAFDGEALWSYDAANRALYRHGGDEAAHKSFAIAEDVVPNALAWVGGKLWMHDTKSRRILVYAAEAERLELRESHAAPDAALLGFAVVPAADGPRLWALVGPSAQHAQPALELFRLRRRIPFAKF